MIGITYFTLQRELLTIEKAEHELFTIEKADPTEKTWREIHLMGTHFPLSL